MVELVLETPPAPLSHEAEITPRCYVLTTENVQLASTLEFQITQNILWSINALRFWASSKEGAEINNLAALDAETKPMVDLLDLARYNARTCHPVESEKPTVENANNLARTVHENLQRLGVSTDTRQSNLVNINTDNSEQLLFVLQGLRRAMHDAGNPLACIKGNLQLAERLPHLRPQAIQAIRTCFDNIRPAIDEHIASIDKEHYIYEQHPISISQLQTLLWQDAFPLLYLDNINISPVVLEGISPEQIIVYSEFWLSQLLINIAKNTQNAYRSKEDAGSKVFHVCVRRSEGNQHLEIDFEDRATGFVKEGVVKKGFIAAQQTGVHGYQTATVFSEGIGMARHAEVLAEHYEGQLIPSQVLDQEGKIIGARVTLRLPINF